MWASFHGKLFPFLYSENFMLNVSHIHSFFCQYDIWTKDKFSINLATKNSKTSVRIIHEDFLLE